MAEARPLFNQSFTVFDPKKQKRKKARVRLSTPGCFFLNSHSHRVNNCHLVDLGTGGLTIQSGSTLYIGDRITVESSVIQDYIHKVFFRDDKDKDKSKDK